MLMIMNYLRAKNENIDKNRLFCEKISSLGYYFDIALLHLKSACLRCRDIDYRGRVSPNYIFSFLIYGKF